MFWALLGLLVFGHCAGEQCGIGGASGVWLTVAALVIFGISSLIFRNRQRVKAMEAGDLGAAEQTDIAVGTISARQGPQGSRRRTPARWVPAGEQVEVQGYSLQGGMFYVGKALQVGSVLRSDPSLIDPDLAVATNSPNFTADGMGYWPSYSDVSPECRAAYLWWLATDRSQPAPNVGYAFLFYYGLERRALVDKQDLPAIRAEVRRLLSLHSSSRSFRSYASSFLTYSALPQLTTIDEAGLRDLVAESVEDDPSMVIAVLGWYHQHGRPLPADYAARVAEMMPDAKHGVVTKRSPREFQELFALRYREGLGEGLVLEASKQTAIIRYRPASSGLLGASDLIPEVRLPDVLHKSSQFKPLSKIWNGCIEDLRRFATKQKGLSGQEPPLTSAMWEAMPAELKAQHDHPDRDQWDAALSAAPPCGRGQVVSAALLGELIGVPARDKYTVSQLRKAAETAGHLGLAIEPDPRSAPGGALANQPFAIWRSRITDPPNCRSYGPVAAVLKLAASLTTVDPAVRGREMQRVTELATSLFAIDSSVCERVEVLRDLLAQHPARASGIARKLAATCSVEQRGAIGKLLVAVSAGDGILTPQKKRALLTLYKGLELAPAVLEVTLAALDLRLSETEPVMAVEGRSPKAGSAVKAPPSGKTPSVQLDPEAIRAILADTREVTALLSTVLDTPEGPPEGEAPGDDAHSVPPAGAAASGAPSSVGEGLDATYQQVLAELVLREHWSPQEIRALAETHRVMPGAILETINSWADDALGDYLITGTEQWTVRMDLLRGHA